MVCVETEQICQLEHFLGGELESGMGAPFERCLHTSDDKAEEGGGTVNGTYVQG